MTLTPEQWRELGWDPDRWKKFKSKGEVLKGDKPVIDKSRIGSEFPTRPTLAVRATRGNFGVGHARIFIAVGEYPGAGLPVGMKYYTTDLGGTTDNEAWVTFEEASKWPGPNVSKSWTISQVRAENAVAVAKQFARMQAPWAKEMPEMSVLERVKLFETREKLHSPLKYGKMGTYKQSKGQYYDTQSTYMTCASYAEKIMHAAGIPAPFYVGLQTGRNLVKYNNNLFHWAATFFLDI